MKQIAWILIACLLLTGIAGCADTNVPEKTPAATQTPTSAPTEATAAATTEATTAVTEPAATGVQPGELAGVWQRTHTEVEGDRNKNTKATLTITGDTEQSLRITYKDKEFPDTNFKDKALTVKQGALYPDCGNDRWFADVAPTGKYSYSLTLLEDGTLLLRCSFDFDGQPMVSYQWFARSK